MVGEGGRMQLMTASCAGRPHACSLLNQQFKFSASKLSLYSSWSEIQQREPARLAAGLS